ncbi:thioredoxin-disulfide reductase [Candidatus Dojkabacteria bacterium]|uniref:Thioredoxin reductase n=1 Tax=Candidatus Dojkabacteria bacterium TaxID=2099670 RepID=A0A955RKM8_9BACT|nr:thioredoxin-disulfide reductase [Candidatus Dojkabacteria bacterium]
MKEIIIIGSGPAGLTAAIYTARANLAPLVIAGDQYGGQLMTTTEVENFPGFPEGIQGPVLMQNMVKQAERFGAEILHGNATSVDFSSNPKKVWVGDKEYQARSVIVASGSSPRVLNIPGEQEFWGKGVSTCATCDGAFYRDKVVAIIGGGDSAMEEATFLTRFAKKVYIIHRRESFRASKIMQERALKNEKIEVIWNTEVKEVHGDQVVEKLQLRNTETQEEHDLELDGMFLAIGHIPNVGFLNESLTLDDQGFIDAQHHTRTNIEGVFVAGDVHDHHYQQAITAAGMGSMAAIDAEQWIASQP